MDIPEQYVFGVKVGLGRSGRKFSNHVELDVQGVPPVKVLVVLSFPEKVGPESSRWTPSRSIPRDAAIEMFFPEIVPDYADHADLGSSSPRTNNRICPPRICSFCP